MTEEIMIVTMVLKANDLDQFKMPEKSVHLAHFIKVNTQLEVTNAIKDHSESLPLLLKKFDRTVLRSSK